MRSSTAFNVLALMLALAVGGLLGMHALWVTPLVGVATYAFAVPPAEADADLGEDFDQLLG